LESAGGSVRFVNSKIVSWNSLAITAKSGAWLEQRSACQLMHVISIYPILAKANSITHFECIPGVNSKNEMKDHDYPSGLKTEERS
jgi:hypothetical protein